MLSTMLRFARDGAQKFVCPQKHCEYPESSTGSVSCQRQEPPPLQLVTASISSRSVGGGDAGPMDGVQLNFLN